ncbi:MAG: DsrE family protein [Desulfobacterales bacterium]
MNDNRQLYILWTNGDPVTSEKMVFMYGINALRHKWWEKVTLIVWGAPAVLATENAAIQAKIKEALEEGVYVAACKACADQLGVSEKLSALGIEVQYTGQLLTDILQSGAKLLTV